MMTMVAVLVFGGALTLSMYALFATIAPHLEQIGDALFDRSPSRFAPLQTLVRAERRIAVRRWAAVPARAAAYRTREAA